MNGGIGGGNIFTEGKQCPKTGLWMVSITNRSNSKEQAKCVGKIDPTATHGGVKQQVNGGGAHLVANAMQNSSRGELTNYHHQSLGSSPTWLMMNILNIIKLN